MGSTGSTAANRMARDADVVIGVGTRYADFTTASQSAFGHPANAAKAGQRQFLAPVLQQPVQHQPVPPRHEGSR